MDPTPINFDWIIARIDSILRLYGLVEIFEIATSRVVTEGGPTIQIIGHHTAVPEDAYSRDDYDIYAYGIDEASAISTFEFLLKRQFPLPIY